MRFHWRCLLMWFGDWHLPSEHWTWAKANTRQQTADVLSKKHAIALTVDALRMFNRINGSYRCRGQQLSEMIIIDLFTCGAREEGVNTQLRGTRGFLSMILKKNTYFDNINVPGVLEMFFFFSVVKNTFQTAKGHKSTEVKVSRGIIQLAEIPLIGTKSSPFSWGRARHPKDLTSRVPQRRPHKTNKQINTRQSAPNILNMLKHQSLFSPCVTVCLALPSSVPLIHLS